MYYPWYFDRSRPVIKSVSRNNAPHPYGSTFTVSVQVTGLNQGTHAPSPALGAKGIKGCSTSTCQNNVRDCVGRAVHDADPMPTS